MVIIHTFEIDDCALFIHLFDLFEMRKLVSYIELLYLTSYIINVIITDGEMNLNAIS